MSESFIEHDLCKEKINPVHAKLEYPFSKAAFTRFKLNAVFELLNGTIQSAFSFFILYSVDSRRL